MLKAITSSIAGALVAICGGRVAAPHASWIRRLVHMSIAAIVLSASIGEAAAHPMSAAQTKTILFLYSFDRNFETAATWTKEIRHELTQQSPWLLDIQEQTVVTARNEDSATEAKFVDYLKALYARRPPDLIVAIAAPAARFVQRHRADLFPTTSMLLAVVEARRVVPSMLSGRDVVVGVQVDQVALVENILRLLPGTKTIAMIVGNSPNERFWVEEQKRVLEPFLKNKVKLIFYNEQPFGDVLKEVASLPPHSAIFYIQLWVDGAGDVYGDKEPLKRIYEVANAPIFSFDDTYFTGQVVGGPMFSSAEGARPTAAAAVRMLGGEDASNIKLPPIGFSTPKYDWRQLQRWNISESRLPPGSEILHRELDGMGALFMANRADRGHHAPASWPYLGVAGGASRASTCGSAVPAAHG